MNARVRAGLIAALANLLTIATPPSFATDSPGGDAPAAAPNAAPADAVGPANVAHGKAISYTCLGCHGVQGYRNAYPNYSVPKLEGQHSDYLVAALKAYRAGERSHATMHAQSESLSDQDIVDIAAFFAGTPVVSKGGPSAPAPEVAGVCVACHGADGIGITPLYPTLSGQYQDYLARALHEYKYGGRKNPVMGTFAAQLNDAQIQALATYYSSRRPSLSTLERPYTRLGTKPER